MFADELRDVRAADLFFTFHDEGRTAGQAAGVSRAHGVHRGETGDEFALVVLGPARVQRPIPDRRLKRWRDPEIERLHGLHVVMVVKKQGAIRLPGGVPHDDRVAGC